MGMDIYGLNPELTEERPDIDYPSSTEQERNIYWNKLNDWEDANPGCYFRANVWSWRVINKVIDLVNVGFNLELDLEGFGSNSGNGLKNGEDCNKLADAIEKYLLNNSDFRNSEMMYLSLGMWISEDNSFSVEKDLEEELNIQYPIETILYSGVVTKDGLARPAWSTSISHFRNFIKFLRNCNGFEIH